MKRLMIVCCAALLLPAIVHADPPRDATYVALKLVKNFPVITVAVNGHPVQLMVDVVGNGQLALSSEALKAANVEVVSDDWLDLAGNRIAATRFRVAQMQIGNLIFSNLPGQEDIDAPGYRKAAVGMGHFGASLLKGYKVVLDYKHLALVLIPVDNERASRADCAGIPVPFLSEWKGEPVTSAMTDFGQLTMVWDTGAPFSLVRKGRLPADSKPLPAGTHRSSTLDLGNAHFGPLDVLPAEFGGPEKLDGFVGFNFFAKNSVCVDIPAKQLLVRRSP